MRRVLPKHPDEYVRVPKCEGCGGIKYYVSHWMNRRDTKKMSCNCRGYVHHTRNPSTTVWEIHRRGSKYCWYRKDGTQRMPGDPDFFDIEMEKQEKAA